MGALCWVGGKFGKKQSRRVSGIRDMLRALKKGAAVGPLSPSVADAAEEHHNHHHHTGPKSVRSASKSRTRSPEGLYPASFSAPKSSPVEETDYPHPPMLPTTSSSRPSPRVLGKFASLIYHRRSSALCTKPPHLLTASASMPVLSVPTSPPAPGPSLSTAVQVLFACVWDRNGGGGRLGVGDDAGEY